MDKIQAILDKVKPVLRKAAKTLKNFDYSRINFHYVFLGLIALIFVVIAVRLYVWDNSAELIDPGTEDSTEFDTEPLDNLVPYTYEAAPKDPEDMVIACFGNAPFADDMGKESNLANMIADKTGATVYNFSFADSYLSCKEPELETGHNDLFSLYWLTTVFTIENDVIVNDYLAAKPNTPVEVKATLSLLQNLDFNMVDVIAIMYDGSDYLDCRGMYNRDDSTNIRHFGGALEASINLIQDTFPHIQIIVMSPPYAYGLEEDGTLVDSTLKTYGEEGPLASYVQYQSDVCYKTFTTFIDTFYGSVNYYKADQLLKDHLHLTEEARELVAEEFMEGFEYYVKHRNKEAE